MNRGRSLFLAVIFLLASPLSFAIGYDPSIYEELWEQQKEAFTDSHVFGCVGNEDNSLFLMLTNSGSGVWKSRIWAFIIGQYNKDNSMHLVWDKSLNGGDVRSLVFSPYSNKFYFTACWDAPEDPEPHTEGLWAASQTGRDWEPVDLFHQHLESGLSYLAVNKAGVWMLLDVFDHENDRPWPRSVVYQVEDTKGAYYCRKMKSSDMATFNSFWKWENPRREITDKSIVHQYEQNFRWTDYTLLICDQDEKSWWVYNCVADRVQKFQSLDLAREEAARIDSLYEAKAIEREKKKPFVMIGLILVAAISFILMLVFAILMVAGRRRIKRKGADKLIEHNKMVFDIQEKERAKISRDIHDSVVQDIRVLRLETENLVVDEGSKQRQTKIEDIATDCIIKLRNICYNLTPAELASHTKGYSSKLELISIINSLVQQFSMRTHIPCVFKVDEGFEYPVLEKEETQNLFRVIQEALTNSEKHSYATQVSIFIKKADGSLLIYITDDGIGCNQEELNAKLKSKEHLGLRSMKDRMELIGGSVEFFTAQNDGMEIKLTLPLEKS